MHWLGPALVFYVAVASALVARRRLGKIEALRIRDVSAVVRAIRAEGRAGIETLLAEGSSDSFMALVLSAALADEPEALRIATVNEHLGDVDREIESQREVPLLIARASLVSGTLASVIELAVSVAASGGPKWVPAAVSFLLGFAGFAVAAQIDRRAREMARLARSEWDSVAAALGDRLAG